MTSETYVKGLRQIADLYEENPDLKVPYFPNVNVVCGEKEEFQKFAKALGSIEKKYNESYIEISPKDFEIPLNISLQRGEVCKKKILGKKLIPERAVPGYIVPAHDEEIIEWDCGSIFDDYDPSTLAVTLEEELEK